MDVDDLVLAIATALDETNHVQMNLIRRMITHCGMAQVEAWLIQTEMIEALGGLLTTNKLWRRTPGGVFFMLAKQEITDPEVRKAIFLQAVRPKKKKAHATPTSPPPGERWENRAVWIESAEIGRVTRVNVMIVGRPGTPVERQGFTLVRLNHTPKLENLPKGLPIPAKVPETPYVVYIGAKQWRRVAESLRNPEDFLICEGVQMWDPQYQVLTVFVTACTTKLLQQAQRPTPPPPPPPAT